MICKCGARLPLMRRVCDDCKRKYTKQYKLAYAWRLRNYHREYMAARRWLNGSNPRADLGPDIPVKLKSINGVLRV